MKTTQFKFSGLTFEVAYDDIGEPVTLYLCEEDGSVTDYEITKDQAMQIFSKRTLGNYVSLWWEAADYSDAAYSAD